MSLQVTRDTVLDKEDRLRDYGIGEIEQASLQEKTMSDKEELWDRHWK